MAATLPDVIPPTFTFQEALAAGLTRHQLYSLRDSGAIESIAHGLYRRADAGDLVDLDLLEIARRAPRTTLCLTTALVQHRLTDANPATTDVALPVGSHRPNVTAPVVWHMFNRATFDIGRDTIPVDSRTRLGLYSPQRCIIDAFRLRHREGDDLAYTALRRWLSRPGNSPGALYDMARYFPTTTTPIREALEILQYE